RHTRSKRDWSSDVCSSDLRSCSGGCRWHSSSLLWCWPSGGAEGLAMSVPRATLGRMNEDNDVHTEFFDTYTRALIDRDAAAIADHYAVPALIEFPGQRISVTNAGQTESFFAGVFGQYEAVTEVDAAVSVIASTGHSIWADVDWHYHGGAPDERNM